MEEERKRLSLENIESQYSTQKMTSEVLKIIMKAMHHEQVPDEVRNINKVSSDQELFNIVRILSDKKDKVEFLKDIIFNSMDLTEIMELKNEINYNFSKSLYYKQEALDK